MLPQLQEKKQKEYTGFDARHLRNWLDELDSSKRSFKDELAWILRMPRGKQGNSDYFTVSQTSFKFVFTSKRYFVGSVLGCVTELFFRSEPPTFDDNEKKIEAVHKNSSAVAFSVKTDG